MWTKIQIRNRREEEIPFPARTSTISTVPAREKVWASCALSTLNGRFPTKSFNSAGNLGSSSSPRPVNASSSVSTLGEADTRGTSAWPRLLVLDATDDSLAEAARDSDGSGAEGAAARAGKRGAALGCGILVAEEEGRRRRKDAAEEAAIAPARVVDKLAAESKGEGEKARRG